MSLSVLKTTSKKLLSMVQKKNLSAKTILAALDVLAPHLKPHLKPTGPLLCDPNTPECALPLGYTSNRSYGLTVDGLQQQMFVQSQLTTTYFQNAAAHIFNKNKGVLFVDGRGDNGVWANLYGHAQCSGHTQRLRAINFMWGGQPASPSHKITHSVNVLSGLSRWQLKSWLELVAQGACDTHPHLKLTAVKTHAAVFAEVYSYLSHSLNVFLTFSHMREWGNIATFSKTFPYTALGQVMEIDFSLWGEIFEEWSDYIAPLCGEWAHVLDQPQPDMHLMQSLRNKDIILTLLPALEKPLTDVKMLSNIIAATFVQHLQETSEMNGVAFFNHAGEIMSSNISQKIASQTTSWGVVWGSNARMDNCSAQTKFLMTDDHYILQTQGLPLDPLHAGEGYLIGKKDCIKISAFYTPTPQAQSFKLPKTTILKTPKDLSTPFANGPKQQEAILQQQMQDTARNLAWCQETVARLYGYSSWHEAIHANK